MDTDSWLSKLVVKQFLAKTSRVPQIALLDRFLGTWEIDLTKSRFPGRVRPRLPVVAQQSCQPWQSIPVLPAGGQVPLKDTYWINQEAANPLVVRFRYETLVAPEKTVGASYATPSSIPVQREAAGLDWATL